MRYTFRDSDYDSDGKHKFLDPQDIQRRRTQRSNSEEVVMRDSLTSERDERRNFEPMIINKNVSDVALLFDSVRLFWANEHAAEPQRVKCDPMIQTERTNLLLDIRNVCRQRRYMLTEQEYNAVVLI